VTVLQIRRTDSSETFFVNIISPGFFHFLFFIYLFRENISGAPTPVRTGNLRLRRPVLYPIELWAQSKGKFIKNTGFILIEFISKSAEIHKISI
jgi:hypothetical protein